jgi:predicted house-cleaning noncanonical NTP pyrophosphatase (MazG superfamily)
MYKLIRDLIPNIIQQTEGVCNYAEVKNDEFYYALLQDKLIEEVNEYLATGEMTELVDIITVIKYIADVAKVDLKELYEEKLKTNGGFDKRLVGFFPDPQPEVNQK